MKRSLIISLSLFLFSGAAFALPQRTFVSTTGSDANPCTRQQPCRVPPRERQLQQTLQRDQADEPVGDEAHVTCISWKPAVKPGPSADMR